MVSQWDTIFFTRSTRLPSHGIQLHFVRKSLFRRQYALALEIAVHHDNNGFIVCEVAHDAGDRVPPCQFAGQLAPVSRHHLIAAVLQLPHKPRHQDAVLPHALRHFQHGLVLLYLEGMLRKIADLGNRYVLHAVALGFVPLLLRGKQAIE